MSPSIAPTPSSDVLTLDTGFGAITRLSPGVGLDRYPELLPWASLAHARGAPITLCEAAVGLGFPSYDERRAWRASLPGELRHGLLVFTEPARLAFVWSWGEGNPTRHVEHRLPGREATLETGLRAWPPVRPSSPAGEVPEILDVLCRRCRLPAGEAVPLELFVRTIEASDAASFLRTVWREVASLRVLDPACVDPAWLIACGRTLEPICLALLERMRVWLDESRSHRRRRPEFLSDFRRLVDATEAPRFGHDRSLAVRRRIAASNLYAAAPGRRELHRITAALRSYAGLETRAPAALDLNTCVWQQTLDSSVCESPPWADDPGVDRLLRAWRMARCIRREGSGEMAELRRAAAQLATRRRQLARSLGGAAPPDFVQWPLLFADVRSHRDFAVVRVTE